MNNNKKVDIDTKIKGLTENIDRLRIQVSIVHQQIYATKIERENIREICG